MTYYDTEHVRKAVEVGHLHAQFWGKQLNPAILVFPVRCSNVIREFARLNTGIPKAFCLEELDLRGRETSRCRLV